jgi:hypothetical protein
MPTFVNALNAMRHEHKHKYDLFNGHKHKGVKFLNEVEGDPQFIFTEPCKIKLKLKPRGVATTCKLVGHLGENKADGDEVDEDCKLENSNPFAFMKTMYNMLEIAGPIVVSTDMFRRTPEGAEHLESISFGSNGMLGGANHVSLTNQSGILHMDITALRMPPELFEDMGEVGLKYDINGDQIYIIKERFTDTWGIPETISEYDHALEIMRWGIDLLRTARQGIFKVNGIDGSRCEGTIKFVG